MNNRDDQQEEQQQQHEALPPLYVPCAACKLQRKRCGDNCELAPYFPASKFRDFQSAQKIFGVSNIQKMIVNVEPDQRQATAESILSEGNARRIDPVHGSFGVFRGLLDQVRSCEKELQVVNQQLAFFREKERLEKQQQQNQQVQDQPDCINLPSELTSEMKKYGHAYNYCSNLEEGGDEEAFDIQRMELVGESHQLRGNYSTGESSSAAASKAKGKQPMESEGKTEDEDGSPQVIWPWDQHNF